MFGQKRISVVFTPQRKCSIQTLQFCADKLVCLDSRNDLSIYSLQTKSLESTFSPPGRVTALITDPVLDYALIGLQNGNALSLTFRGLAS